jgi:hypothetical protein
VLLTKIDPDLNLILRNTVFGVFSLFISRQGCVLGIRFSFHKRLVRFACSPERQECLLGNYPYQELSLRVLEDTGRLVSRLFGHYY